jgi:hypothetical protein
MNKPLAISALVLGLAAAAPMGAALAHPVSVRIDTPGLDIRVGLPVPRVFLPAPVVVAPAPVVVAPPVYAPRPVFYPVPHYRSPEPYHRVRYDAPRERHHRHWDARAGRWCD